VGATIRLTEGEVRASDALAAARAVHRGETVPLGFSGIGLEDGHRLGTRAELAVAKLLHVYPQIGVDAAKDIPDWDLQLQSGLSIEVKFRRPAGADFALNNNRMASWKTDYGVLVWPVKDQPNDLYIAGYMTRADFVDHSYETRLRYGQRLCYPSAKLRPIWDLVDNALYQPEEPIAA